jgi:hypothetical protein
MVPENAEQVLRVYRLLALYTQFPMARLEIETALAPGLFLARIEYLWGKELSRWEKLDRDGYKPPGDKPVDPTVLLVHSQV